jgi:mxaD protein
MKIRHLALLALALPSIAFAHGAKKLSVEETVEIKAPPAKVWEKAGQFGGLGAWLPPVKKTEILEGKDNTVGAVRLLTTQNGGTVKEKLLKYSAAKQTMKYSILGGVLPVSHYSATLTVKPGTTKDSSIVVWSANFKRKDISVTPKAGEDDETATKTIHAVFRAGLDNLKTISEAK